MPANLNQAETPAMATTDDQACLSLVLPAAPNAEQQSNTTHARHEGIEEDIKPSPGHGQTTDSTTLNQAAARTTPEHPLTGEELRLLRKEGDKVTTRSGHDIVLVQGQDSSLLFQTLQPRESDLPSPTQRPSLGSSATITSSPPKRGRAATLLTTVDPKNIIEANENEGGRRIMDTSTASPAPTSTYSLRKRERKHSRLAYDVKYHPMDDKIRPTQAVKRRIAHGEIHQVSDDESEEFLVQSESDTDEDHGANKSEEHGEKTKEEPASPKKGRMGPRRPKKSLGPTRRSSRRTSGPMISYDMSRHPQDDELEVLTITDDESDDAVVATVNRLTPNRSSSCPSVRDGFDAGITNLGLQGPEGCHDTHVIEEEPTSRESAAGVMTAMSTSSSTIATPPPYRIRRKEGLDVWMLEPGERYFAHDRDSWASSTEVPIQIYTDSFQEQLAAEATAALPLNFDHDDKENTTEQTALEEISNTHRVSIMPATQYWRTSDDSHASHERLTVDAALYGFEESSSPYGLGGNDGSNDRWQPVSSREAISEAMTILASGKHLPPGSDVQRQAEAIDFVHNVE
ncbi:hypothetical protein EK21DRAFT_110933 [Setomelanomma holmii]|uniref:Uncharacterized protein n=1 Tax=Setomelanomma holmii TaxID=210430 RepID=A0A9P4LN22_9PLEO|nr:hypothetical protein EK21DRAFT_110933 [Setomelanomma holmii]